MSKKAEQPAVEGGGGKGKGKLILIIVIALVVVIAGAGAAFMMMSGNQGDDAAAEEAGGHADKQAKNDAEEHPPVYERLDVFTVNLAGGENYLQTEISLKLSGPEFAEQIKQRMPEVRNAVNETLSSKTQDVLVTVEGKKKLAAEVQSQVNGIIRVKEPDEGVTMVLFNTFIIQ